jgi:hypothetical protein
MELFLDVLLGIGIVYLTRDGSKKKVSNAVHRAFGVYANAATLVTFSVQLASVVILVKKDFGISAQDFGGLTVEVTWAAALLTMLTMLPMLLVCSCGAKLDRPEIRLSIICISWVLFLYTFLSRMISNFGPSQISVSKPGAQPAVMSPGEAANIERLCWSDGKDLSKQETVAFDVFAIGGSLFLSIVVGSTLIWMLLTRRRPDMVKRWQHSGVLTVNIFNLMSLGVARLLMVCNVFLWGVPQLWAILRFRAMQQALAGSIGSSDQDNSWSFGQIVVIVMFLPVLLEFAYVYMNGPAESDRKPAGHDVGIHNQGHSGAENDMTFRNAI